MNIDPDEITNGDLAFINNTYESIISEGVIAIEALFREYNSERIGDVITKIRESEGIDPDMIDQIFGVQPEEI